MPLPGRLIRAMPHRRPITARIPPDLYASERAAVRGKILALKGQIRDLLRELNELTPVGRLSSELVVEIFTYLKQEQQWSSPKKAPFILTLTHVSRSWRAIALNCPALWNEIFFSDKTLVGEWLRRSRSSNLYVKMQAPLGSVLQRTLEHFHRIRGLWLEVVELPPFPDVSTSVLSELTIKCQIQPSLTSLLLSRLYPELRILSLQRCGDIDLQSTIFTDLTSLEVVDCSITTTVIGLLDLLGRMSRLTSLKLDTVSLSHGTLPDHLPSVTLSTVLEFVYRGSQGDLDFLFLSQLTFTEKSLLFMFDTNVPSFQRLPSTLILSLITDILTVTDEITELHLDFGSDTFTLGTPLVHFGIRCPTITMIYDRYISWMSASFPLFANLEEIYLSGTIIPEFWPIFVKMDRLFLIQINSEQSRILFNLLVENWHHRKLVGVTERLSCTEPNDRPELLFPTLRTIGVEQTDFRNVHDDLIDALMHRCHCKKQLSFLGIEDCSGIREGFVDQLRMAVVEVDWDEVGELDDDDDDDDNEGDDDDEEE